MNISANVIWNILGATTLTTAQFGWRILQNADLLIYARHYNGTINGIEWLKAHDFEYGMGFEVYF